MAKRWTLTEDAFERLLNWLDADRDRAGEKYEDIRHSLIKTLVWRGCHKAEELADETINRVTQKLPEIIETYSGNPALYFYGVARKVLLEYNRARATQALPLEPEKLRVSNVSSEAELRELESGCLEKCLGELGARGRELILRYYKVEGLAKINYRRELAERMGITTNTLRVRAHRLRSALHHCISDCVKSADRGEINGRKVS
jgi:RNA polymerase sigma factor (sigma-70 family)